MHASLSTRIFPHSPFAFVCLFFHCERILSSAAAGTHRRRAQCRGPKGPCATRKVCFALRGVVVIVKFYLIALRSYFFIPDLHCSLSCLPMTNETLKTSECSSDRNCTRTRQNRGPRTVQSDPRAARRDQSTARQETHQKQQKKRKHAG